MLYAIGILALIGHFSILVAVINRTHAADLPYWLLKVCNITWYAVCLGLPTAIACWAWALITSASPVNFADSITWLITAYVGVCLTAIFVVAVQILWGRREARTTERLLSNDTKVVDVQSVIGSIPASDLLTRLAARIPGNEIFQLSIHDKTLVVPRLSDRLDGLTICHLSDLHFTGQISRSFFDEVVRQANDLDCDLLVISGDIIDKRICIPWIPAILGQLKARLGCFYVLGNHDKRVKNDHAVRHALAEAGLVNLGAQWRFVEARGEKIILAGNELPWYVPAADLQDCPYGDQHGRHLRMAVAHSPDQLTWARAHDIDVLFAGHTHGGQFRLPYVGPVLSPSRYGVRFSAGTFHQSPTTMHVSRGISGTRPLRFDCPPDLARLVLRCGK